MVAKTGSGLDEVESLLETGAIPENASVTDIAALLAGTADAAAPSKEDAAADTADKPADGAPASGGESAQAVADAAAAKAAADAKAAAPDDKKGGEPSDPAQAGDEPEGPIASSSSGKTIPYAVLKGTREQLARATASLNRLQSDGAAKDQEIAQLKVSLAKGGSTAADAARTVQDAADTAGIIDAQGRPVDVATVDIEALRGEFPKPVIDAIEALQASAVALHASNAALHKEVGNLRTRETERGQREALTDEEQLQADIDAVPTLALWAADSKGHKFDAAVAMDGALRKDPEWAAKPRTERFQEVVRLLGGDPGPTVTSTVDTPAAASQKGPAATATDPKQVSAALRSAAARAAPVSHSDLPAGSPAAQSDLEGLDQMDVTQLAAKMSQMTPAQQEQLLERIG